MISHCNFNDAFADGVRVRNVEGQTFQIEVLHAGRLNLPNGRILACDPTSADGKEPFARTVKPGLYDVLVSLCEGEVAAAMIQFSNDRAIKWELATRVGEDIKTLLAGQFFGYGVDSGTGCFADPEFLKFLDADQVHEEIASQIGQENSPTCSLPNSKQAAVIAFVSGSGDGSYASWWGLNSTGDVVALATDFFVMLDPEKKVILLDLDNPSHADLASAGIQVVKNGSLGFQIRSSRSFEVSLVNAKLERLPVRYSVQGDAYTFLPDASLPKDARMKVEVNLAFVPWTRT